jgi:glycosyltransferase involved in cell wall biosynthesis
MVQAISEERRGLGVITGLISVVIPYYNTEAYIEKCVASVAAQTYNFCEVVIVDDGSKQPLPENKVQAACPTLPVFVHRHPANRGAAAARNTGFEHAIGEFLFFLDSDTVLNPDTFALCLQAIHTQKAHFAYGDFKWGHNTIHGQPWSLAKLREKNYVSTMALVRRSVFPRFDEKLLRHQDWDLWLTIGEKGHKGAYVGNKQLLFETPVRKGSISGGGSIGAKQSRQIVKSKHGI